MVVDFVECFEDRFWLAHRLSEFGLSVSDVREIFCEVEGVLVGIGSKGKDGGWQGTLEVWAMDGEQFYRLCDVVRRVVGRNELSRFILNEDKIENGVHVDGYLRVVVGRCRAFFVRMGSKDRSCKIQGGGFGFMTRDFFGCGSLLRQLAGDLVFDEVVRIGCFDKLYDGVDNAMVKVSRSRWDGKGFVVCDGRSCCVYDVDVGGGVDCSFCLNKYIYWMSGDLDMFAG
jgi:hypothetical protein